MNSSAIADMLLSAPAILPKRCATVQSAIDDRDWQGAASALRALSANVVDWATKLNELSEICTTEAKTGRLISVVPRVQATCPTAPVSLEAIEAGLLVVANSVSRDCALRARRAMDGVMAGRSAAGAFGASPAPDHPAAGAQV